MLTLADVIEALTHVRPAQANVVITEAAIDSRQVIPGSLFVAIRGERVDGHDYIAEAFQRGASFALIEHDFSAPFPVLDLRSGFQESALQELNQPFCLHVENSIAALQCIARFWRRKLNLRVVGITGSVGKSTTKELVADVLSMRYHTLRNPGNLNNEIGLPLSMLRLGPGYSHAVLEMGFYVIGEIAFLCDLAQPHIGIVTYVGTVHAERAGSQEAIAQGKGELVEALPDDGVAILNYDNHWVRDMAHRTRARVLYYGLNPAAELWADDVQSFGLHGIKFRMHYQGETLHVSVPLIGRHSVHNALAAMAAGLVEGLTWDEILGGLSHGNTQLRLSAVRTPGGALMLDDTYNASPESVLAALNLLAELEGRKIAVLGDMRELGQYENQGHALVGMRAAEVAEILVTLGQRGRLIAEAARRAGMNPAAIFEFDQREDVTAWLAAHLRKDDAVLIKGSRALGMDRIAAELEAG